jgi:hypothetical protein
VIRSAERELVCLLTLSARIGAGGGAAAYGGDGAKGEHAEPV